MNVRYSQRPAESDLKQITAPAITNGQREAIQRPVDVRWMWVRGTGRPIAFPIARLSDCPGVSVKGDYGHADNSHFRRNRSSPQKKRQSLGQTKELAIGATNLPEPTCNLLALIWMHLIRMPAVIRMLEFRGRLRGAV